MTTKAYDLSFVWTPSNDAVVSDEELKNYYEANSFNYTNAKGKQLTFDEAKETATKDLKLKKTKKSAQKAYIAFKKGTTQSSETITLPLGDLRLTPTLWNEIETKSIGDILKPKVVGAQYVTVKINSVQAPKVMTYEQAKEKVTTIYDVQAKKEALLTLAESTLKTLDTSDATVSDFVTLTKRDNLESLNSQESLQFLQKLFTSNKEKGIISVLDKVIVYNIIEQKLLSMDANQTDVVKQTVNQMKKKTFESNLLKMLDKQYPTEVYMGGLIN
jgi:peptidyl-prolyl cis-trans isomerase D